MEKTFPSEMGKQVGTEATVSDGICDAVSSAGTSQTCL